MSDKEIAKLAVLNAILADEKRKTDERDEDFANRLLVKSRIITDTWDADSIFSHNQKFSL